MKCNYLILTVLTVSSLLLLQTGCQEKTRQADKPKTESTAPKPIVTPSEKAEIIPEAGQGTPRITFEKIVHDFGEVAPGTKNAGEFKFTNTGDGLLKITKVDRCCGTITKLSKNEYAPGESGALTVEYRASQQPGSMRRNIYVNSNDKQSPRVELTIRAKIATKVDYEPERLSLMLKEENAGCPDITITSIDNKPFSIKQFKSTGNCITTDINSQEVATKFILSPKVDIEKLQNNLNGFIEITLTHPSANKITITYNALPVFKIKPPVIIVFNVEPQKPVKRDVWVLNNYGEDFELESTSSKKGIVKVLNQEKINNGYHLEVEMIPPDIEGEQKFFTDELSVEIKGNNPLGITCRGFYARNSGPASR